MGKSSKREKISRNIIFLGITSLLNDFSSEMIMPVLPFFIASLGGTGFIIGIIGGLRDSITSILQVFSGYISDKEGKRKKFVISGYFVSGVFKFLLSLSRTWVHALVFSSSERLGKALRTAPRDAIISQSIPKEKGKGFGIHRALDTLGAVLGSIAALLLFWFLGFSFKTIILLASVFSFFALLPLIFVKEPKFKREKTKESFFRSIRSLSRDLKIFILVASFFSLSNFSYMFFILKAKNSFSGNMSFAGPILLYITFSIFYAFFSIPFGILSDKIGRGKILFLGYFLFSLVCLGFALFNSFLSLLLLFPLYGITYAILDANQKAFVSDLSKKEERATAIGAFNTSVGIIALPASMIAGFFWDKISFQAPFIFGFLISLSASIIFLVFIKKFR